MTKSYYIVDNHRFSVEVKDGRATVLVKLPNGKVFNYSNLGEHERHQSLSSKIAAFIDQVVKQDIEIFTIKKAPSVAV